MVTRLPRRKSTRSRSKRRRFEVAQFRKGVVFRGSFVLDAMRIFSVVFAFSRSGSLHFWICGLLFDFSVVFPSSTRIRTMAKGTKAAAKGSKRTRAESIDEVEFEHRAFSRCLRTPAQRRLTSTPRPVNESAPAAEPEQEAVKSVIPPTGTAQEADDDDDDDFGPMPVSVEELSVANKKRRGISPSFPYFSSVRPLITFTLAQCSHTRSCTSIISLPLIVTSNPSCIEIRLPKSLLLRQFSPSLAAARLSSRQLIHRTIA